MPLPITIPNTFATKTSNIPLSELDTNFTTVANGVNGIGNGTNALANVAITGGTVANAAITGGTMTNVIATTVSFSNVTITGGTITGITDLAIVDGGTGASNAAAARTNLSAAGSGANSDITSLTGLTTPLSVPQGGTGATTLTANAVLIGGGANAISSVAPGTSGNVLTSNGTTWSSTVLPANIVIGTSQPTTSGTAFTFTGIPSTAKKVTVMFNGVSLSGSDSVLIQLGTASGIEDLGYIAQSSSGTGTVSSTAGFIVRNNSAGFTLSGAYTLFAFDSSNNWIGSGAVSRGSGNEVSVCGGNKTLSGVLTQLKITRDGSNTFDLGSINILYEI
jgi:hypothetical protein